jgi:streptomycin 6-kinase
MEPQLRRRIDACARAWHVDYDHVTTTATSVIAFGTQHDQPVVLKIIRCPGDEWNAGTVAAAFDGCGVVRVIAHQPGAVLLERLSPGTPLVDVVRNGNDDRASAVIALLVREMQQRRRSATGVATAEEWGNGFAGYLARGDRHIDAPLVKAAHRTYADLCSTQRTPRLLHGDLQHYNILHDEQRGWTAIDPKGVIAELEFEFGAALRNPHAAPELYANASSVEHRIHLMTEGLQLDVARVRQWAMAQAVLSAIWTFEDHGRLDSNDAALVLANTLLETA